MVDMGDNAKVSDVAGIRHEGSGSPNEANYRGLPAVAELIRGGGLKRFPELPRNLYSRHGRRDYPAPIVKY